ncbi:glycosyltransferase [Fodinibius sp. SL11]|uniref:glycosyltransferase n=1 Tax=Fodinibius sp. SL11 TaxID=3425690 RepID=UPI003F880A8D
MKKLCLIIPSLQAGGMERVMSELIQYFDTEKDVKIDLVLYGKNREIFFSVPSNITIHKPSFDFVDFSRFYSALKTMLFLRRTVKKINPDVILSFGEYWNNLVLLSLWGLNFPVFISDRCQPNKHLGSFHEFLRRRLYPEAAGIIAQTTKAKDVYVKQELNDNIKVIGNPIYEISTNGELKKENIILTVGRLITTKHHDRLIKIFKKLSPNGWKLVIVGGDALKQSGMERLKKMVRELQMVDSIELTGTVSDIESYYKKSKIFAFTSSSEGFPNVIGEAMSAGLPIISYDCVAGPSDLIEEGSNGFLVPTFNDNEFLEKLKFLIVNQEERERMGQNSKRLVQRFSKNNIGEQYFNFLQSGL